MLSDSIPSIVNPCFLSLSPSPGLSPCQVIHILLMPPAPGSSWYAFCLTAKHKSNMINYECILGGLWLRALTYQLCGSGHVATPVWAHPDVRGCKGELSEPYGAPGERDPLPLWLSVTNRDPWLSLPEKEPLAGCLLVLPPALRYRTGADLLQTAGVGV